MVGPLSVDAGLLTPDAVRLGCRAASKRDAIGLCGRVLVELGAVDEPYVESMQERERSVSTFIGRGVAIPHGTAKSRLHLRRTALAVLQFPDGIDWGDDEVSLCIALAADGDERVDLLFSLATMSLDEQRIAGLRHASDAATVIALLQLNADEISAEPTCHG
jgi:mannitol/fructose-specific phosphotransferase system IIA component